MALPAFTEELRNSNANKPRKTDRNIGMVRFATDEADYEGQGFNAGLSVGQVSRVTFAAPGTLVAGARVYLSFKENRDCEPIDLELHNCETTAKPLAQLVADKINGTIAGSAATYQAIGLNGYSATVPTTPANTVEITGVAGVKFAINPGQFGLTIGTIANPPVPTITLVSSSASAAPIKYGSAVVTNPRLADAAYPKRPNSRLAQKPSSIIYAPTDSPTERIAGIVIARQVTEMPYLGGDCGEDVACDEGSVDCHDCAHYLKLCCHDQQIKVRLEALPAGSTVPVSLIDTPLLYRVATNAANPSTGSLSIKVDATADPTRKMLKNDSFQAVIAEVVDAAQLIVWVQVIAV
jgi:hypothetical protein